MPHNPSESPHEVATESRREARCPSIRKGPVAGPLQGCPPLTPTVGPAGKRIAENFLAHAKGHAIQLRRLVLPAGPIASGERGKESEGCGLELVRRVENLAGPSSASP